MARNNPNNSGNAIEMQRRGSRVQTGESLSDPERIVSGLFFSGDYPYMHFTRSVKAPRYLNDKISGLPDVTDNASREHQRRLDQFHLKLALSHDSKSLLNRHVWVTGLDGYTSRYRVENTVAQNLDVFQQGLSNHPDRKLTLCAINVGTHDEFDIFVPSYQRTPVRFQHPRRIILRDRWRDCDEAIEEHIRRMQERPASKVEWKPQLPSRTAIVQPPSTEPSICDLDISLEWVHEHPKFEEDWSLYVSEKHARRPIVDTLRLVTLTTKGSTHHRLVLLATSGEALERCKLAQDKAVDAGIVNPSTSTEAQVFELLLVCVAFIVSEVSRYIAETVTVVQELDMASRRNPSVSKVQLLMHLRECHQWAAKACDRNARLISKLFVSPFLPVQQHVHRSQSYVDDLRYLIDELDTHAQEMDKLKEDIVAQIDLSDKRRNRNIGMFIAMYVPLAFATSFFGMNIEDRSAVTAWSNTTSIELNSTANFTYPYHLYHYRNESWNQNDSLVLKAFNLPVEPNTPASLTSTQVTSDQPGSRSWPLWMFYAVAGPLTFGSIILPLVSGRIYRYVVRYSIQHRRYFRTIVSITWLATILLPSAIPTLFLSVYTIPVAHWVGMMVAAFGSTYESQDRTQRAIWGYFLGQFAVNFIIVSALSKYLMIFTIILWLWILFNWTMAPKGYSWSISRSFSGR